MGWWLIVTGAVFSFGQGVIHTYYTVALAPAIGALVAIGGGLLWSRREHAAARPLAAVAVGVSVAWAYVLLDRTPSWQPWLRTLIVVAGALAVLVLLLAPALGRLGRRAVLAAAILGAAASIAGPLAYAADTVTSAHTGSIPSAGPASAGIGAGAPGAGGAPGGAGGPARGGAGGAGLGGPSRSSAGAGGVPGLFGGVSPSNSAGGPPGALGAGGRPGTSGAAPTGAPGAIGAGAGGRGAGGAGGKVAAALVKALQSEAGGFRWVAATSGSQSAASLELASDEAVMAIGGFSNQGGKLSLAAFERTSRVGKFTITSPPVVVAAAGRVGRAAARRKTSPAG